MRVKSPFSQSAWFGFVGVITAVSVFILFANAESDAKTHHRIENIFSGASSFLRPVAAPLRRGVFSAREKHGETAPSLQQKLLAETNCFLYTSSTPMPDEPRAGHPRRPPRLERLFSSVRPFYFVTFNTYKRRPFLARPQIHERFRAFCTRAESYDVAAGRYVIMPDHIHLFVAFSPREATLPGWMQMLKTVLGKELLRMGIQKPHWQEGFLDHVLRNSESYSQKWDYVRLNPVRAGLCAEPDEWVYQGEIISIPF
jgi:REP element-mobilizing transposase RayT